MKPNQKIGLKFVRDSSLSSLLTSAFQLLREIPCVGSRLSGISLFLEVSLKRMGQQHFTHLVLIECFVWVTAVRSRWKTGTRRRASMAMGCRSAMPWRLQGGISEGCSTHTRLLLRLPGLSLTRTDSAWRLLCLFYYLVVTYCSVYSPHRAGICC